MSLTKSVTEFFANLTKEPAEEAGGMVADRIRFWRIKQAISLKEKLEAHLKERGITDTREVPLKLTVAVLDGATIEDDDVLHSEWSKLLTNAVDPNFKDEIRVAFTDILRSMNAFDARLLHEIYGVAVRDRDGEPSIHQVYVDLIDIANRIGANKPTIELSRDCLIRQRCIELAPKMHQPGQQITHEGRHAKWVTPPAHQVGVWEDVVFLTELGEGFVKACS